MTRRMIAFIADDGVLHVSQEFNGDRAEMERFGLPVKAQCTWGDVHKLFEGMRGPQYNLKNFRALVRKIEDLYGYKHVTVTKRKTTPKVDYLYVVTEEGCLELVETYTEPLAVPTVAFTVTAAKSEYSFNDNYKIYCVCKTYQHLKQAIAQTQQQNYRTMVHVNKLQ